MTKCAGFPNSVKSFTICVFVMINQIQGGGSQVTPGFDTFNLHLVETMFRALTVYNKNMM